VKYAFMKAHQAEFGVRAMCRVLRVHFSGFYAWLKELLSQRAQDDARQTELIRRAWSESGKVYGVIASWPTICAIRGNRFPRTGSPGWQASLASWPRSATNAVRDGMAASLLWLRPTLWTDSSRSMVLTRSG
jgi:hypothetical protein